MIRFVVATMLLSMSFLGACDVPVKSQVPSHVAEFTMPTRDYPRLLAAFDAIAETFRLKRFNAAPGLDELHGRDVMFAAYEATDKTERRGVLEVNDLYGAGKVLIRVYDDGVTDVAERTRLVADVAQVVARFGGMLALSPGANNPKIDKNAPKQAFNPSE